MRISNIVVMAGTLAIGFGTALSVPFAHANADLKFGVVDMQKALQSVESGKKAKAELEKEYNNKQKSLQAEEAAIKKLGEEFKKQSMVLSEDAKIKKSGEIQERMMKYREQVGRAQAEIQDRERKLTDPIIQKLATVIDELGNKQGYTMILEKSSNAVLFIQKKEDVTDEVIKQFNKKNG